MKKATIMIALVVLSVASAFGQGTMKKDPMMGGKSMMKKGKMQKMHSSSMKKMHHKMSMMSKGHMMHKRSKGMMKMHKGGTMMHKGGMKMKPMMKHG